MSSSSRLIRKWILLSIAVLSLTLLLSLTYPLEELSRRLGDLQFRLRPARATSSHVALVLIDDASLARFGRWPWNRSLLARLLRQAAAQKPAAIGLDIILSEPGSPEQDRDLAQAIHDAGNVVLAARLSSSPQDKLWIEPLPAFADAAVSIGHVQGITGPDGICRSVPVQEVAATGPRWAMAVEVFRVASNTRLRATSDGIWAGSTFFGSQGGPGGSGSFVGETFSPAIALIDFRKQLVPGDETPSFLTVSAADLLDEKLLSGLEGKSLLVGLSAIDGSDRVFTPVSDRLPMPGVELHANLVDELIEGRSLSTIPWVQQLVLLACVSLLCAWVALRWPGPTGLAFTAVLVIMICAESFVMFVRANMLLDLAPLLCATVLAFPLAQVETFVSVNRGLTKALGQMRQTLSGAKLGKTNAGADTAGRAQLAPEISWKLDVLSRLREELASLYNFRQNLLLAMEEGVAVYGEDGRLLFSNPFWHSFCEQQHWDPDSNLDQLSVGFGNREWANLPTTLRQHGARLETEIQTGDSLWQLRAFRVETGDNVRPTWMLVATDLTTRLERDRARSEAIGFVTHELRTPLSSIQGFAEFLMRYPESANGPEVATTIFRESQRLIALINTYLDVLRMEAGHAEVRREQLNVRELVTQVQRIIEPLAQAADCRVAVEIASDLPRLEGDPNLIAGVLLNLVNNAVKHGQAGGEIRLKVTGVHDSATFEVSNPGPQIPPEDLERIFDSFYRGRQDARSTRGWGLGLAFVKRIAESHGGRVEVTSDSAATLFRIVLPCAAQQRAEGA